MKRHWLLKLQFRPFLLNYIQVLLPLIYSSASSKLHCMFASVSWQSALLMQLYAAREKLKRKCTMTAGTCVCVTALYIHYK